MHHTATHNIGLGSYNDDFNHLMKDLLMMDQFVKGFYKNRLLQRNGHSKKYNLQSDYYKGMVHGCHSKKNILNTALA